MNFYKRTQNYLVSLFKSKDLLFEFTKRDFQQRYKGSLLGVIWALLSPLLMLGVYSFIFVSVFKSKWGSSSIQQDGKMLYTMMIFAGLVPFQIFSESVNRSVSLLGQSANYIKKVVIPIEILPTSIVLSTVINSFFSVGLLILGKLLFLNTPNWTLIFVPLVLIPIMLLSLGFALIVAAFGIYIKDLVYVVGLLVNILFYMSPIFYSADSLPARFRFLIHLNPIAPIINHFRDVFINGELFSISSYITSFFISFIIFILGLTIFNYLRKGFADVI
ncbi:ABC transporter permease [Paenibacillus sp. HW567]|uniref:ABC transporter permease n=1 Tax=Paenibacillus sp. HW567 TaxID=1034769 RepID=UPI0003A7686A|nr:ABC transporter permease [Paenibacillus sp. HW567]